MKSLSVLKNVVAVAVCCLVFLSGCCTTCKVPSKSQGQDFGFVKEKVWQLAQVRDSAGNVVFDSSKLDKEKFNDVYTLQFSGTLVSGKAAPNRYTAPYTLGSGDAISLKRAASTMMFGIHTPDGLDEMGFFNLLEKVSRWSCKDNVLSIYTSDNNILIFNEFDYRK